MQDEISQPHVIQQEVQLDHVTLFLNGAELFGSSSVNLPAGESELVLSNVASFINEQSINVAIGNDVTVLSVGVRTDYRDDETLTESAKSIEAKLKGKQEERERLQIQVDVLKEQVKVLQANRRLTQEGISITTTELGQMVDFIAERSNQAWSKQADIGLKLTVLDKEIVKITKQFEEERNKRTRAAGKMLLKLLTKEATTAELKLSYVAHDAGWNPSYDFKVEDTKSPLSLIYKAKVYQNTGIHWKRVPLTLSTGNPSQGTEAPTLYPWHLQRYAPPQRVEMPAMAAGMAGDSMMDEEMAGGMMLSKSARSVSSNALNDHVTTHNQGTNTHFEIDIPYTIPCDGQEHLVMIKSSQAPATYQYVVSPKLDAAVFLQAHVEEWQGFDLIPGQTNIYYDNSYIGQGYISFDEINEGMNISLGRERRILVERVEDANNRSKAGLLSGGVQRTFAYTIKLHNTRNEAVTLLVKDQLPVSQDSEIQVTDLKLSGAEHDEKAGELSWKRVLQPSTPDKISYSYAVRFPKDLRVEGI